MPECRNKICKASPASAFLTVGNRLSPVSEFRCQGHSGTTGNGLVRHCPAMLICRFSFWCHKKVLSSNPYEMHGFVSRSCRNDRVKGVKDLWYLGSNNYLKYGNMLSPFLAHPRCHIFYYHSQRNLDPQYQLQAVSVQSLNNLYAVKAKSALRSSDTLPSKGLRWPENGQ